MSQNNTNGRWEFDENGNCHYVPAGNGHTDRTSYSGFQNQSEQKQQNQDRNKKDSWQWFLIIGSFIVGAWPIGLVLLILKLTGALGDKKLPGNVEEKLHYRKEQAAAAVKESYQAEREKVSDSVYYHFNRQTGKRQYTNKASEGTSNQTAGQRGKRQQLRQEARMHGFGNIGLFRGIGIALTSVFGACSLLELFDILEYPPSISYELSTLLTLLCFMGAGITFLGVSASRRGKMKRYLQYLSMIGTRDRISIPALAKTTGKKEQKVIRDLRDMLERGYFERGYIDMERQELVLTEWVEPEVDQEIPQEPAENQSVQTIRKIRSLNNDIADPAMSEKIDRIESLTARIFRLREEHPEKESELRSFMNYYLPETLKLLERYAQLEAQNVDGENISSAMTQIEDMMDKVADAFEAQLDKLFESDAMDISADLKVMEQMLQKDGLTEQEIPF